MQKCPTGKYTLEVIHYDEIEKYTHRGYMMVKFRSRKNACSYYKRHNPHMREMIHGMSDWDPVTRLAYVIREDYFIIKPTIPPFDASEMPIVQDDGECHTYIYNYQT